MGKAKTALMTAIGTHARRCAAKNDRTDAPRRRRRGHNTAASTAQPISGTKTRKHACPWIRNQPVSVMTQASRAAPVATEPAAAMKATYAVTYMYGIQSVLSTPGCTAASAVTTAKQATAARNEIGRASC